MCDLCHRTDALDFGGIPRHRRPLGTEREPRAGEIAFVISERWVTGGRQRTEVAAMSGLAAIVEDEPPNKRHASISPRLSARELEVLELSSYGRSAKEIARHLNVGVATVNTLLDRARVKLGATGKTHAVALAIRSGLLK